MIVGIGPPKSPWTLTPAGALGDRFIDFQGIGARAVTITSSVAPALLTAFFQRAGCFLGARLGAFAFGRRVALCSLGGRGRRQDEDGNRRARRATRLI